MTSHAQMLQWAEPARPGLPGPHSPIWNLLCPAREPGSQSLGFFFLSCTFRLSLKMTEPAFELKDTINHCIHSRKFPEHPLRAETLLTFQEGEGMMDPHKPRTVWILLQHRADTKGAYLLFLGLTTSPSSKTS